jgi:nucleoside-diphosphate-sugar epimerase
VQQVVGANQTFLGSDGEDVSTSELLRRMRRAMGRPARLIPVPVSWLNVAAAMVGKPDVAQRLCGSLQVDIEKTRRLLGWSPPLSLDEGLRRAAGMPNP